MNVYAIVIYNVVTLELLVGTRLVRKWRTSSVSSGGEFPSLGVGSAGRKE